MIDCNFKNKYVKIRKPRVCEGCSDKFDIGSKMHYQAGVFEGYFYAYYICDVCSKYMTKHWDDFADGFGPGELKHEPHYQEFKKSLTH